MLQQDCAPVQWALDGFNVSKMLPEDAHFFEPGDKPGPLDRRGRSYVMWNTDHFAWTESTDPIYKSIPFFLAISAGGTIGVLFDNEATQFKSISAAAWTRMANCPSCWYLVRAALCPWWTEVRIGVVDPFASGLRRGWTRAGLGWARVIKEGVGREEIVLPGPRAVDRKLQ